MQPLRFRAWDGDGNRMIYFGLLDIYDGGLVLLRTDGHMDPDKQCDLQSDYVHIMQYTGLKDKNGREIYEGDILKFTHFRGATIQFNVYWDEKEAGFCKWFPKDSVEMIGNVYEGVKDAGKVVQMSRR